MKTSIMVRWASAGSAALMTLLVGCTPSQVEPTASTGDINVQRYVAVGDSYSSGFSDGGLTRTGQENSFPALLAKVFQRVADAPFTQPLLEPGSGTGYLRLKGFDVTGLPQTERVASTAVRDSLPVPSACGGTTQVRLLHQVAAGSALPQNLGVPGLQLTQVQTPNYGNATPATPPVTNGFNPYFERLLPANDRRTYLNAVTQASRQATFFTYFAGLDDFLPYLRTGAACGGFPKRSSDITSFTNNLTNSLNSKAKLLLDSLGAGTRPGIIAQLPPLNLLPLLKLGGALDLQTQLQVRFADKARIYIEVPLNRDTLAAEDDQNNYILATAIPQLGQLTYVTVGGVRQQLPYGRSRLNPVKDKDVIDYREYNILKGIVTEHNDYLRDVLATRTYKMPLLSNTDARSLLNVTTAVFLQSETGSAPIAIGGVRYSTELVRGGIFSLDYYSLTPRGNGLLANAFINAINFAYKAKLPFVDVNNLPTTAQ